MLFRSPSALFICRCCFRCGVDKIKFSAPQDLMCRASVACVEIQNVCPDDHIFAKQIQQLSSHSITKVTTCLHYSLMD